MLAGWIEQTCRGFVVLEPFAQRVGVEAVLGHGVGLSSGDSPGLELITRDSSIVRRVGTAVHDLPGDRRSLGASDGAQARVRVRFRVPVAVEIRFRFVIVRTVPDTVRTIFRTCSNHTASTGILSRGRGLAFNHKGQEC